MKKQQFKPIAICVSLLLFFTNLQAQFEFLQTLDWKVYTGVSAAFPVGETAKEARQFYKTLESRSDSVTSFKGHFFPRIGFNLGFRVDYPVFENFSAGIGLQFTQRGYRQKEKFEYHDLEFQYDEKIIDKSIVRINVLEIPLVMSYRKEDGLEVFAGFTTSFLSKDSSAYIVRTLEKKVIANGEYFEPFSTPKVKEEVPLIDEVNKVSINWLVGFSIPVKGHFSVQTMVQYSGKLFSGEADTRNLHFFTGLAYDF